MSTSITAGGVADQPAFLSKERIIAKPGFNRWLVPVSYTHLTLPTKA